MIFFGYQYIFVDSLCLDSGVFNGYSDLLMNDINLPQKKYAFEFKVLGEERDILEFNYPDFNFKFIQHGSIT